MLRNPAPPTIYFALDQRAQQPSSIYLHVKTAATPPAAMMQSLATALSGVNAGVLFQFTPMEEQVNASLTRERLLAMLTGFFGALGLLLAGVGLFGVTSYAVTQRRAEISVRLAIGATPERIMRLVLGRVALLVAAGIAAGATLTWWLAQFVSATQLYSVQPRDGSTIAAAAVLLAAVAGIAAWWPARRAAHLDPAPLLREA
jgi:ABC-type antimicrobial peptide transport system permease subunit